MSLSNKQSFHFNMVQAQNATAFPKRYYPSVNNRSCIAEAYRNNPYPLQKEPEITEVLDVVELAPAIAVPTREVAEVPTRKVAQSAAPVKRTLDTPAYHPIVLPKVLPNEVVTLPIAPKPTASPERIIAATKPAPAVTPPTSKVVDIKQAIEANATKPHSPIAHSADTAKPTNVKRVWKQGRGSIEKVDKLTGEIFHLVEEAA